jgi:pyrroloquinoline quinone biosynthesis protein D
MPPELEQRPRLAPGCRLSEASGQGSTLMMPESALQLKGPGLKIVQLCDGAHSIADIIRALQAAFPQAQANHVEKDIVEFLKTLHDRRALDFE